MSQKADKSLSSTEKILAVLSYIGPLGIIGLLGKKDSPFVQTHAKQGVILFAFWFVLGSVASIFSPMKFLVGFLVFIVALLGIVMAAQGKTYKFPVLSDIAEKIEL